MKDNNDFCYVMFCYVMHNAKQNITARQKFEHNTQQNITKTLFTIQNHESSLKRTVLGQSGRSEGDKLDGQRSGLEIIYSFILC